MLTPAELLQVWQRLDGTKTVKDIADEISTPYNTTLYACRKLVDFDLAEMDGRHFIARGEFDPHEVNRMQTHGTGNHAG